MKIKTTIMFDEDSYTKLKDFAHHNNESIGTVVRTAVDYLLRGKIGEDAEIKKVDPAIIPDMRDIPEGYSSSVTPSTIPSTSESLPIKETPEEAVPAGLSGKIRTCPICYEKVPVELIQKHYDSKHEGI